MRKKRGHEFQGSNSGLELGRMRISDGQDLLGSYEFMMVFDAVPVDVKEAEGGILDLPPKEETLDSILGQDGLEDFLEWCVRRRRRVFWMHSLFEGQHGKFGRSRHLDRVWCLFGPWAAGVQCQCQWGQRGDLWSDEENGRSEVGGRNDK